jgi:hypothetical protein
MIDHIRPALTRFEVVNGAVVMIQKWCDDCLCDHQPGGEPRCPVCGCVCGDTTDPARCLCFEFLREAEPTIVGRRRPEAVEEVESRIIEAEDRQRVVRQLRRIRGVGDVAVPEAVEAVGKMLDGFDHVSRGVVLTELLSVYLARPGAEPDHD